MNRLSNIGRSKLVSLTSIALVATLLCMLVMSGVMAEGAGVPGDTSPAIAVTQKTAASVVGVITFDQTWNQQTRETMETMIGQGSGVVIKEGGYILTNYHVIENGSSYKVLMPSGEKVAAELVGGDSSTDLAVLKVEGASAGQLAPVTIGSSSNLQVGSTAIAIGNPGGEALANTVTQGIVSALEREVGSSRVTYIQHDASINSGNSGGGLFNFNGELVGINTLKYAGSAYSTVSFEGLGFAIPIDTAYPIAMALIDHGKVLRPQMGVTVSEWPGPDEPMSAYPPASVCVYSVNAGSPAEAAGMKAYDFITHVNGVRVTTLRQLTAEMDKHKEGDVVEVTVVRYANLDGLQNSTQQDESQNPFGPFGNPFGGQRRYSSNGTSSSYETLNFKVQLQILE